MLGSYGFGTYIVRPLLKWAGGKRHIADELFKSFPCDWNSGRYFEPFVGGAAMYLHLVPIRAKISDLNIRLVNFYKHVKLNHVTLADLIDDFVFNFNSEAEEAKNDYYLQIRKQFNDSLHESLESAALLYVINKLCFNGLYRENSKGGYNVPFGKRKKFPNFQRNDLFEASKILTETEIVNQDFADSVVDARSGDFVYFDPPYIPLTTTSSFTSYNSAGFGIDQQKKLATVMLELKNLGVKAICSNSDTHLTREIYGAHRIDTILAPRMVSASALGRGNISELVIKNF